MKYRFIERVFIRQKEISERLEVDAYGIEFSWFIFGFFKKQISLFFENSKNKHLY
jgi:hypothetical protein